MRGGPLHIRNCTRDRVSRGQTEVQLATSQVTLLGKACQMQSFVPPRGAILVLKSANRKTGPIAVTYASVQSTCPKACALRDNGCYAQSGRVGLIAKRLDRSRRSRLQSAADESRAIDAALDPGGRPLRLHVSGDASTPTAARIVSDACARWRARGGGPAYTYTHAWRRVPRAAWGSVSVLASVESLADGRAALEAGYAPAAVVGRHSPGGKAHVVDGVRWIPCPQQTRGIACDRCRLCMRADALRESVSGIAFEVHGHSYKRILNVIQ